MKIHPVVRFVAFSLLLLAIPAVLSSTSSAQIGIGISVRIGPPGASGLRAAHLSRPRLSVDARLLGLER